MTKHLINTCFYCDYNISLFPVRVNKSVVFGKYGLSAITEAQGEGFREVIFEDFLLG